MSHSPAFKSPFTDLTACTMTAQHSENKICAKLEMNLMDCMEAYGIDLGRKKCDMLVQDFQECISRNKQLKRFYAMRIERQRQYWAGERQKEELYAQAPARDSY